MNKFENVTQKTAMYELVKSYLGMFQLLLFSIFQIEFRGIYNFFSFLENSWHFILGLLGCCCL